MSVDELIREILELPNSNPTLSNAYFVNRNDIVDVISEYEQSHYAVSPRPLAKGRWIRNNDGNVNICSVCHHENIHQYNFCPRCGSDMRSD